MKGNTVHYTNPMYTKETWECKGEFCMLDAINVRSKIVLAIEVEWGKKIAMNGIQTILVIKQCSAGRCVAK